MIGDELVRLIERIVDERVAKALADGTAPSGKHVSVAEYASRRSIAESTVRAAIRTGRLPSIKSGRAVRVPADVEIAPVEAARKSAPTSDATTRAEAVLGITRGGKR